MLFHRARKICITVMFHLAKVINFTHVKMYFPYNLKLFQRVRKMDLKIMFHYQKLHI